jgi:hypothetical protein
MPEPADPPEKGYWRCHWSESATYADADPRDPKGEEVGRWLASLDESAPVLTAPAAVLLEAFYAGWEAACADHRTFTENIRPEWVEDDAEEAG